MSLWKNRIVGYADVDPATLTPHHGNWRLHPKAQQMALAGVLSEIGIVQNVLVNQRTGRLVDGHLRVELALEHKQPAIGVTYVDLSESEEAAILATLDPLSALAETDAEALGNLLGQFSFESSAVNDMLSGLLMPADDGLFADEPEATATEDGTAELPDETLWPSISVRVPPTTLQLYKAMQDQLSGSDESAKFVDLLNRASSTL
jgi:hypothetical protein